MTIEGAIKHCEEVAEENEGMCRVEKALGLGLQNDEMLKCASEHRQLAEWLRELKAVRESWLQLAETITEIEENAETQEIRDMGKFLVNYMGVLEKEIMEAKADDSIDHD